MKSRKIADILVLLYLTRKPGKSIHWVILIMIPSILVIYAAICTRGSTATVRFPWEYIPMPKEGDDAEMVGRDGRFVCRGKIAKVMLSEKFNKTAVVTAEFPADFVDEVISISRNSKEKAKAARS